MTTVDVCMIVSRRELARARVLVATLHEHQPDATLTVLLLDGDPASVGEIEHARLLGLEEVAGEQAGLLTAANPPGAMALAVLPQLARHLMVAGAESVIYLGAGQRVLGPLEELAELVSSHQVVLVANSPLDSSGAGPFRPDPSRGAYSHELLALRSGPATTALLAAWPRYFASGDDAGAAAVSAWLDGVPAIAEDVAVLRGHREDSDLVFDSDSAANDERAYPAAFDRLQDGALLTPTLRTLLVDAIRADEVRSSPFTEAGRRELYAYCNQPAKQGRAVGLTRLHMAVWAARDDLRLGYPHIDGPDGAGFAGWLCLNGAEQEGLVAELLPPTPDLAYRDANPHVHEDPPRWGVNVAGFFTAELGVGEAARLLISGLDAASIPALPIQGHLVPPSRQDEEFAYARIDEAAYPVNILAINGDGVPVFAREAGRSFFEGRYTIALWWWEVGEPPADWLASYEFLDEIWVASQHIYDAIAPTSPVPVVRMTLPVLPPKVAAGTRAELGLPEDGFLFLYVHDYHSVAARKNPLGLIEAFRRAFPPGSGAKLVLKSINAETRPDEHERVVLAARGHEDITLLDAYVSGAEKNAMIAACDCYVSLHRSEGFGLTAAEAMLLGKPVIATRYGGTLEFMNDENSYLVGWEPTVVGEGAYPYPPEGIWAEPDLDQAAGLMRHVLSEPDEAARRGGIARREMLERHSPAVAGEAMRRRLALVHERLYREGSRSLNLAHLPSLSNREAVDGVIGSPPVIGWGSGRLARFRERLQRPVANWARAYIEHQGAIDTETQSAIARIDSRLHEVAQTLQDQQQGHHAETLAVLRRLEAELADLRATTDGAEPEAFHVDGERGLEG
jgi:glycosyltransferase involved in cell wall biosynthesis